MNPAASPTKWLSNPSEVEESWIPKDLFEDLQSLKGFIDEVLAFDSIQENLHAKAVGGVHESLKVWHRPKAADGLARLPGANVQAGIPGQDVRPLLANFNRLGRANTQNF